jgi:uncharacterized protein
MSKPILVPNCGSSALELADLEYGDALSRHRAGLALPVGMRGRKARRTAETQKETA